MKTKLLSLVVLLLFVFSSIVLAVDNEESFTSFSVAESYRPVQRGIYSSVTDCTYLVYLNTSNFEPWIIAYNHTSNSWTDSYSIDPAFSKVDDQKDHFYPSMWVNDSGYIHVIYGAHNGDYEKAHSTNPYDITSWTLDSDISGSYCYSQPLWSSSGDLYVWLTNYDGAQREVSYRLSTDGGNSFGSENLKIAKPVSGSIYFSVTHEPAHDDIGERVHFAFTHNRHNGQMYPVYYAYMNVSNGNMYNITDSDLGVTITSAEYSDCLVKSPQYDANRFLHVPIAYRLKNGKIGLLWVEETETSGGSQTIGFSKNSSDGTWSSNNIAMGVYHDSLTPTMNVESDGDIVVYYCNDTMINRYTSSDNGSSWSESVIYTSSSIDELALASFIDAGEMGSNKAAHNDFMVTMKQFKRDNRDSVTHHIFAYGANGFINESGLLLPPSTSGFTFVDICGEQNDTDLSDIDSSRWGNCTAPSISNIDDVNTGSILEVDYYQIRVDNNQDFNSPFINETGLDQWWNTTSNVDRYGSHYYDYRCRVKVRSN